MAPPTAGASPARARTTYEGQRFRVLLAEAIADDLPPGAIEARRRELVVGTGQGSLRLHTVQPTGKKPMPGPDWARGVRLVGGEVFA